mmetsp:Transcript_5994/g.14839  ORF Transcript_5994/g.14839 Transcript_5994/m.14839 type:complete len:266 (-) Transcript_5994:1250-2047(-)
MCSCPGATQPETFSTPLPQRTEAEAAASRRIFLAMCPAASWPGSATWTATSVAWCSLLRSRARSAAGPGWCARRSSSWPPHSWRIRRVRCSRPGRSALGAHRRNSRENLLRGRHLRRPCLPCRRRRPLCGTRSIPRVRWATRRCRGGLWAASWACVSPRGAPCACPSCRGCGRSFCMAPGRRRAPTSAARARVPAPATAATMVRGEGVGPGTRSAFFAVAVGTTTRARARRGFQTGVRTRRLLSAAAARITPRLRTDAPSGGWSS